MPHTNRPSTINTVVTIPPWARDEPQSADERPSRNDGLPISHSFDADASLASSNPSQPSPWWALIHPHQHGRQPPQAEKPRRALSFRHPSMSWLPSSHHRHSREPDSFGQHPSGRAHDWNIHQTPPPATVPQSLTPTLDSPNGFQGVDNTQESPPATANKEVEDDDHQSHWQRRKRKLRTFILTNNYVPLIFRFTNLTFTTAALAVAIQIRRLEAHFHLLGAISSSPLVVIIFAPLTLMHVMVAIYLEYFGHPLGLWRTSDKLAHTLSEVFFICAWSAALSLSFDDFFTSDIPCTSLSNATLSAPPGSNSICGHQLALICLVGVGVVTYCTNLIISLFRVFEKIKYHPAAALR